MKDEDAEGALREAMEEAFPDARVVGWESMEPEMPNHPKDRHVAAAASVIEANIIVTSNIRDFLDLPPGIVAMPPDQFLCELLRTKQDELFDALDVRSRPIAGHPSRSASSLSGSP